MSRLTIRASVLAAAAFWSSSLLVPQFCTAQVPKVPNEVSEAECSCSASAKSHMLCLVSMVEDTLNSKVIEKPEAIYPMDAKSAHISGDVAVEVIIGRSGNVAFAWIKSGDLALSGAALDAAYKLRIKPTKLSGRPVYVKSVVTYRFRSTP